MCERATEFGRHLVTPLSRWRHVETNSTYTVVGLAVCSTNGPREHTEESVVYWSDTHLHLCYREVSEFLDGRFVPLGADGTPRWPLKEEAG